MGQQLRGFFTRADHFSNGITGNINRTIQPCRHAHCRATIGRVSGIPTPGAHSRDVPRDHRHLANPLILVRLEHLIPQYPGTKRRAHGSVELDSVHQPGI